MARTQIPVTDITPVKAALTTACAGTNNDLVYTAVAAGEGGNDIEIAYIVAGTSTALSVAVDHKTITVNVATNGGGSATSTSAQVKSAVEASVDATALVTVAHASANDGTGVVAAFSATNLAGGSLMQAQPAQVAANTTDGNYFTGNDGYVWLEVENTNVADKLVDIQYSPFAIPGATAYAATESVPAGDTVRFGPFAPSKFNQNQTKDVYVVGEHADVKFRALRATRAT